MFMNANISLRKLHSRLGKTKNKKQIVVQECRRDVVEVSPSLSDYRKEMSLSWLSRVISYIWIEKDMRDFVIAYCMVCPGGPAV